MKKPVLVLSGSTGKMGKAIASHVEESKIHCVLQALSSKPLAQKQRGEKKCLIDFSSVKGFEVALRAAKESKTPFVSGTTGITQKHFSEMKSASKSIPILWAANFSEGIQFLKMLIPLIKNLNGFDVEIMEFHHRWKKDKPSGTALALEEIFVAHKISLQETQSVRGGGQPGRHEIHLLNENEELVLTHQALSRKCFAAGAVRAAIWLMEQKNGFYTFEDCLKSASKRKGK